MRILAIETSCDETGVAVVDDGRHIISNVVASQLVHQDTGGIVPEVAAREHLRSLDAITQTALREAGVELRGVDAVAATVGPGLIGCLLVGANYARGLALSRATCTRTGSTRARPRRASPTSPRSSSWSPAHTAISCSWRRIAASGLSVARSTTLRARRSTRSHDCSGSASPAGR